MTKITEQETGPLEGLLQRMGAVRHEHLPHRHPGHPSTTWGLRRELGISSARVRHRRARAREEKGAASEKRAVAMDELVRDLQTELRRERAEILEPLLRQLSELGERLRAGQHVPPEVVEKGLALLDRYVRQLHDVHIRQFAEAGLDHRNEEVCFLPMAQIEGEPERAERRVATVRAFLSGYRGHMHGYENLLGLELRNECIAELSWEGYSEDYAKTCVPSHLSESAALQWKAAMARAEAEFDALHHDVQDYLAQNRELLSTPVVVHE